MRPLTRRDFIRYALVGAAAFSGGFALDRYAPFLKSPRLGGRYHLAITEALVQMVDRSYVYHWVFEDLERLRPMPQLPGPLIDAFEGEELEFTISNNLPDVHGFRVPGVPGEVGAGLVISPGETKEFSFKAPGGGSYLYYDHLNEPVNRVMGLHGPMIILPKERNTPYSNLTLAVQQLFDDLGTTGHFPGEPWKHERTKIWLFSQIDPTFNEMVERSEPIDAQRIRTEFLPRYFVINGVSGAYASHDHSIVPSGFIGQPHVIRLMNAGLAHHSPHLHANHFYVLAKVDAQKERQVVQENVPALDSVTLVPLERMDWLHPFIRPPDIPGDPRKPLRELCRNELSMTIGGVAMSPMSWPMHCHLELSQTAAGGNYPQGAVTIWELLGDLDGVPFPHSDPTELGGPPEEHV